MTDVTLPLLDRRPALLPALIGAAFLLAAIADWPYAYYLVLRYVITGAAVMMLVALFRSSPDFQWGWLFRRWQLYAVAVVGVLWLPSTPFEFAQSVWQVLDGIAAALLVAAGLTIDPVPYEEREGVKPPMSSWKVNLIIIAVIAVLAFIGNRPDSGCPNIEYDNRGSYCAG